MQTHAGKALLRALVLVCLLPAVACGKPKQTASSPTVAAPTAGALITPQQLAQQPGGIDTVRVAYNLLLDKYYRPLKSNDLLHAAWDGIVQEAQRQGSTGTGAQPRLTGDRSTDFNAFRSSFSAVATHGDAARYGAAAVDAMAQSLHDKHTLFFDQSQFKQQQQALLAGGPQQIFGAQMLPGGIGYLHLTRFPEGYAKLPDGKTLAEELDATLHVFEQQGVKGWLLDLRDNPGGSSDSIATLVGRFVPSGLVTVFVDSTGQRLELPVDGHYYPQRHPLAVLINRQSGSASELTAAAIKEYGVGRLFGTKTAGDVNGAEIFPLPGQVGLEYTILEARTGKDQKALDGVGIEPDQTIQDRDQQAQAAETWLLSAPPPAAGTPPAVGDVLPAQQLRSQLSPYAAKLSDLPESNSRLLGDLAYDTPDEFSYFAPRAHQLAQTAIQRGWQGEFNQYFGTTASYTYQLTIDIYRDAAGAHQAMTSNDFPQSYANTSAPAQFGEETVAQKGIVSSLGQTVLRWRRGRVVFSVLYISEPGLESFAPLLQMARAVDARYQQNPLR